jgi:uncharacterized membrane protein
MKAVRLVAVYLLTLVTFLALDSVWLGVVARDLYRRELGSLLAPEVRWVPAVAFYLLYAAVLVVLVVVPNRARTAGRVATLGGLFGLGAYATYDLTNLATVTGWPVSVTLVDLVWGAAVTGLTAVASRAYDNRLLGPVDRGGI